MITDESRPVVRATQDVDLIADVTTRVEYYKLGTEPKELGFREDVGDVICRWRLGELQVNVMPIAASVLSFTNKGYAEAMSSAKSMVLSNGDSIGLIDAPYILATKVEAFHGRGRGDFTSHDLEDIINVVDGRPTIVEEIQSWPEPLKEYLHDEIDARLPNPEFFDSVPGHLRPTD